VYCAATPGGVDADQIVDVHVLGSQPPPNVTEGPVLTIGQEHFASAGSLASISHCISRQLAHGASSGHDMWWKALLTFCREKVDVNVVPSGARSWHEENPNEKPLMTTHEQTAIMGSLADGSHGAVVQSA
jgi:hypothetical protein